LGHRPIKILLFVVEARDNFELKARILFGFPLGFAKEKLIGDYVHGPMVWLPRLRDGRLSLEIRAIRKTMSKKTEYSLVTTVSDVIFQKVAVLGCDFTGFCEAG